MQEQNKELGKKVMELLGRCDLHHKKMDVVQNKLKKKEEELAGVGALYSTLIHKETNAREELINVRYHLEKTFLEKEAFTKSEALKNDFKTKLRESESRRKELQKRHDHCEAQKKELQEKLEQMEAEMKELQKKDDQSEAELQEAQKEFINVCMQKVFNLCRCVIMLHTILLKYKKLTLSRI